MTTFLLIRHGANDTVGKSIAGRRPGVHLNDEGRAQAERLAERLAKVPLAAVYASPLERTWETAQYIARRLGQDIRRCDPILEIDYGEWTDREISHVLDEERWKHYNAFRSGTRIPQGELMLEVQARIVVEMGRLRSLHPDETIALVSHGDLIRSAIAYYIGIPLDLFHRLEISCASVSILALHDYGARLIKLNDTGEAP
jgi:probable phosphoglycerate mutase